MFQNALCNIPAVVAKQTIQGNQYRLHYSNRQNEAWFVMSRCRVNSATGRLPYTPYSWLDINDTFCEWTDPTCDVWQYQIE